MLKDVLVAIIDNSKEYQESKNQFEQLFKNDKSEIQQKLNYLSKNVEIYLKKQFPDDLVVKFSINPPEFGALLKNFDTTVNDETETSIEAKGDGM